MSDYVYAPKADTNHAQVRTWYEQLFCSFADTHKVPLFGDAVVGCAGVNDIIEIKAEDGKLRPSQVTFARDWRGAKPVLIRDQQDVVEHVQSMRSRQAKTREGR